MRTRRICPPLSPWTGVGDWTTFKGDAAHRGHLPVQLNPSRFSLRWLWRDSNPVLDSAYTYLPAPISIAADGTAYLVSLQSNGSISTSVLHALHEADGSERWSSYLGNTQASAPTVAAGQVYFLTGNGSEVRFWSLEARTGNSTFQVPVPLSYGYSGVPSQPVIVGQKAYVSFRNSSLVAETKALDTSSGAVLWSVESGSSHRVPLAADAQRLYLFRPYWSGYTPGPGRGFGFSALDLATGSTAFTIVKPPTAPYEANIEYRGSTPVLTGNGRALVNRNPDSLSTLECVDLASQTLAWEVKGSFDEMPAVVGEVFYVIQGNRLEARNVADGHLLWSWSPSQFVDEYFSYRSDLVATNNIVFFSTNQQVYALDVETRSIVWSYPAPGSLSLSASGILYIVRYAPSDSGNLVVEGKVAAINLR